MRTAIKIRGGPEPEYIRVEVDGEPRSDVTEVLIHADMLEGTAAVFIVRSIDEKGKPIFDHVNACWLTHVEHYIQPVLS